MFCAAGPAPPVGALAICRCTFSVAALPEARL